MEKIIVTDEKRERERESKDRKKSRTSSTRLKGKALSLPEKH